MGMLEIPGSLKAGNIQMDADVTGGGASIGNKYSEKFSAVDSAPLNGVSSGQTYTYSISAGPYGFYYAKMILSGKDLSGTHRTAEIEVFDGKLQAVLLSNIPLGEIDVAVYGGTIRVVQIFSERWFFSNHVEGFTGSLAGGYNKHLGNRAIVHGGSPNPPVVDTIEEFSISSGAASITDFGELVNGTVYYHNSTSNGSRVLSSGGLSPGAVDDIDFINVATRSDSLDFGELTQARQALNAGDSDGVRGMNCGGLTSAPASVDTIDFSVIGTLSNATDFGELGLGARHRLTGVAGMGRLLIAGGETPATDNIEFINIQTLSDSFDFGELTQARAYLGSVTDENRMVVIGGAAPGNFNTMDYVNIGRAGDATDFGDLTATRSSNHGTSNGTKGVSVGGFESAAVDTIDIFNIGTSFNNATDFGNLSSNRYQAAVSSGN